MKNLLIFLFAFSICSSSIFSKEKKDEIQFTQYYDIVPNVSSCTPGVLKQSVISEVLDKVNHIRSLHKLKPVSYEAAAQLMSMEGCLNMVASGQGGHIDNPSTPCYTPGGGQARMKSNIEYGSGSNTPIGSIVGWLIDDKNADVQGQYKVGHRRAILNPFLTKFAFGRADGTPVSGGFFSASNFLYQDFTNGNISDTQLDFVAYPFENYPPSYINKSFYMSFNAIASRNNLWQNINVSYASTTVEITDETGTKINVHSVGNDNEGWGSFPNNLSWKADGIVDNVKYNVTIKNVNVNGTAKNYTYWFKLTDIDHTKPPQKPILSLPENLAQSVKLNAGLSWNLNENTSKYHLQLSEKADFSSLGVNVNNLSTNAYFPPQLKYETTYWWRVAAINDAGTSAWSDVYSFTTTSPVPAEPVLSSPLNNENVNSTSPVLSWNKVNGAQSYSLQVCVNDAFIGLNIKYSKTGITDTFNIVPANHLENATDYYWRVKAVNGAGESSYSAPIKFNTGYPHDAPVVIGPANGIDVSLTPHLQWQEVSGANSYNLQVSENQTFSTGFAIVEFKWPSTSYVVSEGVLKDGKTYYWRVRANSELGSGKFSETFSFIAKNGTSVDNIEIMDNLNIYPNPSIENVFLEIPENETIIDIILKDAVGNNYKISSDIFKSNNSSLNLNHLSSGIYFVIIKTETKIYSGKITLIK